MNLILSLLPHTSLPKTYLYNCSIFDSLHISTCFPLNLLSEKKRTEALPNRELAALSFLLQAVVEKDKACPKIQASPDQITLLKCSRKFVGTV